MNKLETVKALRSVKIDSYVQSKKSFSKGKAIGTIPYIPWFNICRIADNLGIMWDWSIESMTFHEDRIYLIGKLTIHCDDGIIQTMATATEELNCGSFGDPSSNAEAMALRRCFAKVGLARQLWAKDEAHKYNSNSNNSSYRTK